jgi:predicted transcriptional regulator
MSENTVHDVANRLLASPRKSLRVLSQEIGLSRSTCQRAAKKLIPVGSSKRACLHEQTMHT